MSKGDTRRKSQVSDTQFTNNWNTIFKGSDMPSDLLQNLQHIVMKSIQSGINTICQAKYSPGMTN